jgi:hypothetical protein
LEKLSAQKKSSGVDSLSNLKKQGSLTNMRTIHFNISNGGGFSKGHLQPMSKDEKKVNLKKMVDIYFRK